MMLYKKEIVDLHLTRFNSISGSRFLSLLIFFLTNPLLGQGYLADPQSANSQHLPGEMGAASKVKKFFDFEERSIHYNPSPMHWYPYRNGTKGEFPHYATGKLSNIHARSGEFSFQLLSEGGSVGFAYDRRRIQAKPGNDFQVSGYVHFEYAKHCRAKISCAITNRRGEIIPGSIRDSDLHSSADQDNQGWAYMELYVPGNYRDARYITLTLFLLQERQWNRQTNLEDQIFRPDVKATAWFDDISVTQVPRIVLLTKKSGNVFESDQIPEILLDVEGVGTLDYQVKLDILDARGKTIRTREWVLTGVEGTKTRRVFSYPKLLAGYYKAEISILSSDHLIAVRKLSFIKCAPLRTTGGSISNQFGITALDDGAGDWNAITRLAEVANAKWLKLPVWSEGKDTASLSDQENLDTQLLELQKKRIHIIAAFTDPPNELSQQLDVKDQGVFDIFSQDPLIWKSHVSGILAQFAQQIPFWQVGSPSNAGSRFWDSPFRPVMEKLNTEFVKFIKEPAIAVSLENHLDIDSRQVGTKYLSLILPAHITPAQIPSYIADHHGKGFDNLWTTLETLPPQQYSRSKRLIDLAQRLVYAQSADPEFIFIHHPWNLIKYNARNVIDPSEHFLVFRTLSNLLENVDYVGRFELKAGIPAFIFKKRKQGFLVTWNENHVDPDQISDVSFFFGPSPHLTDLFGNLVTSQIDKKGMTQFQVSRWPVLFSNIDASLAEFRSELQFSPAIFEATVQSQQLTLTIANTFHTDISGRIHFPQDDERLWTLSPSSFPFLLNKGQTLEREVTLKLSRNITGGQKELPLILTIEGDQIYNIPTHIPFEIRLPQIDVYYFARPLNKTDLLIQKVVTNNSAKRVSLVSFIDLPDGERLERSIARLEPGGFVTRSYSISGATQWMGQYIRLGVYNPNGSQRINYQFEIN